jgi:hypothetical protein
MVKTFQPRFDRAADYRHFLAQKFRIERHYPAFRCSVRRGLLECIGTIQPSNSSPTYRIRLRYTQNGTPSIRILTPHIEPKSAIHMSRNGDLCLYHSSSQPWLGTENLHATIIPWTAEWFVFYELYLSEGQWLGPEAPHGELSLPTAS